MARANMPRRSLRSIVLLGILAISVLSAWALVRARRAPIERAEAILHELRNRGLNAYWGGKTETTWYLIKDSNGQPVGYAVRARWRQGDGYDGVSLLNIQDRHHAERWAIDVAASHGTYAGDGGGSLLDQTRITLSDGQVAVGQAQLTAANAAPDNYIPEGCMHLVVAQVADADGPAVFSSVFNSAAIQRQTGEVNFTQIKMTPLGDGAVRATADVRGIEGPRGAKAEFKVDQTYHVDSTGRVVRLKDNDSGIVYTMVDVDELAKVFAEVSQLRQELLNIAPEEPTTGENAEPGKSPDKVEM